MVKTIGNPLTWGAEAAGQTGRWLGEALGNIGSHDMRAPRVRKIGIETIAESLRKGLDDFAALRSDVIFLVLVYPVAGALLAAMAFRADLLHMVFPLAAGFALLGPVAGIGLYEMSKRRERGEPAAIADALRVLRASTLVPVLALSAYLFVIFAAWLYAADAIHQRIMGAETPGTLGAFAAQVLTTQAGWDMIVTGTLVGLFFAALVLVTSVVAFPMLIDRPVGLPVAVSTSLRVAAKNPGPLAAWGLIIAGLLVAGSLPLFLGLIVVLPVLGHASWHFYRAAVSFED